MLLISVALNWLEQLVFFYFSSLLFAIRAVVTVRMYIYHHKKI